MMLLLQPPAAYDHPYRGQVIEQRLSQGEIFRLCRGPTEGCAWVRNDACHIALPRDEKDARLVALMRHHEIAHCNGWPAYHPGGHWVAYGRPNGVTVYKHGGTSLTLF